MRKSEIKKRNKQIVEASSDFTNQEISELFDIEEHLVTRILTYYAQKKERKKAEKKERKEQNKYHARLKEEAEARKKEQEAKKNKEYPVESAFNKLMQVIVYMVVGFLGLLMFSKGCSM